MQSVGEGASSARQTSDLAKPVRITKVTFGDNIELDPRLAFVIHCCCV